jgi:hypothetical protein
MTMHGQDEIGPANQELVHHEATDVNIRAIFTFALGLFIVAVVVHFAVWGMFRYFDAREAATPREYPLAAGAAPLPPEPRLQVAPRTDMSQMLRSEDERLTSYGWENREAGAVRIPIAEAMRLTLERGLPVRPAAAAEAAK